MNSKLTFKQGVYLALESIKSAHNNKFKILLFNLLTFGFSIGFILISFKALALLKNLTEAELKQFKNIAHYKQILILTPYFLILVALIMFLIISSFAFAKKLTNNESKKILFNSIKNGLRKTLSIKLYTIFVLFFVIGLSIIKNSFNLNLNQSIITWIYSIYFLFGIIIGVYSICFVVNKNFGITYAIKSTFTAFKNNFDGILSGFIYLLTLTSGSLFFFVSFIFGACWIINPILFRNDSLYITIPIGILLLSILALIFTLFITISYMIMSHFIFITKVCDLDTKNKYTII